jgi:HEAT repeat protein
MSAVTNTETKLGHIITQLKHPLPAVRYNAALALGEMSDPDAVTFLFDALEQDHSQRVRKAAATSLAKLGVNIEEIGFMCTN